MHCYLLTCIFRFSHSHTRISANICASVCARRRSSIIRRYSPHIHSKEAPCTPKRALYIQNESVSKKNHVRLKTPSFSSPTHLTYSSIYAYIHTCIHAYIHTCIHAYIHTYTHIHTYIYTYIHTCMHTYIHTYIWICVCGGGATGFWSGMSHAAPDWAFQIFVWSYLIIVFFILFNVLLAILIDTYCEIKGSQDPDAPVPLPPHLRRALSLSHSRSRTCKANASPFLLQCVSILVIVSILVMLLPSVIPLVPFFLACPLFSSCLPPPHPPFSIWAR